jgi:hypothetical protein
LLALIGLFAIGAGTATQPRWRPVVKVPGIVDVVGPRADGRLVLAARGGLFLLRPGGVPTPYARGPLGYAGAAGETYLALAPGRRLPTAKCSFRRDDVFALDPISKPGVVRIDGQGKSHRFADLPAGVFPSGITFDRIGRFGYRLLVTATAAQKTAVYAIDCAGRQTVVANGPGVEGGIAVAPASFGRFGGMLVAADEVAGKIFAFGAKGTVQEIADPGLPHGGDIGVEALGFVPRRVGRLAGYLADLGAPGSPTTGSESLLVLPPRDLARARLRPGDLLVATEASATTIAVRCRPRCSVRRVATGPAAAHAEGHVTFAKTG